MWMRATEIYILKMKAIEYIREKIVRKVSLVTLLISIN